MTLKKRNNICSKRSDPVSRFPQKLIRQIVQEVEEGLSRKEACAKYGMTYGTVGEWMKKYGSEQYHANKKLHFSSHQRRSIVWALQEGRMTKDEAHLIHKVGKRTLGTWLREAKKEDCELADFNQHAMMINKNNYSEVDLYKQLSEAKLKIKALEIMIDIAEQQFKIPIRKKPGAKQ